MKAITWDAATRLFKEVITGRVFTASSEPSDIADGDLWVDSSSTPVLKARVGGTIYEVVGAGGGGPCSPAMLVDEILNAEVIAPELATETETLSYKLQAVAATPAVRFDTLRTVIGGLSPAGYWKLDDAASPPQDSSGNARHASATTGTTYRTTVSGAWPGSYVTLPATNKIPVTNNNAFEITTAPGLTIFFLARPTAAPASAYNTFAAVGPSNWEFAIEQQTNGAIYAYTMTAAGALVTRTETAAATVTLNQWQAICVTISGTSTAATIDVYKNSNTALAKTVTVGAGTVTASNTAVLQIGAQTDLTTKGMIGSMAHFAIFPGVMSGTNIGTIMAAADADGWF